MVVNGWAWVVERCVSDNRAEYLEAQQDARRHGRGLWSDTSPEPPWNFKRRQRRLTQKESVQGRLL
jgi:endonuclease YncB( thermonuclease family)